MSYGLRVSDKRNASEIIFLFAILIYPEDREKAGNGKQNHFRKSATSLVSLSKIYKIDIDIGAIIPNKKKTTFIDNEPYSSFSNKNEKK